MHVVHVIEATIGGTRRHVVDACRGLQQRGLRVSLIAAVLREPAFRADMTRLQAAGVEVIELPMQRAIRPLSDGRHLLELERWLRARRPDVVHTHSSKAGVLGRLASLSAGVGARVHTPHTFAFLFGSMFGPVQRRLYYEVERQLAGSTDRLVAVSEDEARSFRSTGFVEPRRIAVVRNGIDPVPWISAQPAARSALGTPPGAPVAAVVGLLNLAKGQDLALRALREPGLEKLHLWLAGHGEMHAELQSLAHALRVAERVRFLGWRDDVPALLAAADFVLVPSRWEGMPYVVLEALASGRSVVATRVDGARGTIEPGVTGFLAEVESVPSIADACRHALALGPEQRAAMGAAGRSMVLARCTLERMLGDLCAVYEAVA